MKLEFPRQVARRFEQAIADHTLAVARLVTCEEMAKRFGATPAEMSQVLLASQRKGIIQPRENCFEILGVMEPTLDSLFQHTAKSGMTPSSDVRATVVEPAPPTAAEKLNLPVGAPVYRLERTRNVNGEGVANQVNYIPCEICPGLEEDDMTHHSFQRLLEIKYHVVFAEMKENIFLAPGSESDQKILGLPTGAQVLVIDRIAVGRTGYPLVWADIHIRPDRYHYVAGLWPSAGPLVQSLGTSKK